jgi:serine/threonine-protein kinase HipA
VFPGLQHDAMALKVNGKAQRLRRADFLALAAIADLRAGDAKAAIDEMLASMTAALDQFALPPPLQADAAALALSQRVLQVARERVRDFD